MSQPLPQACPYQSGKPYSLCCQPYHVENQHPPTAEWLMRSRYSAYALQRIDYIINTTMSAQQKLLDRPAIADWSRNTDWCGLDILAHYPRVGKHHAQVEFNAFFNYNNECMTQHELSTFVRIGQRWYFLDPTVTMSWGLKQPCLCGSGIKFKHCCGPYLD